MSFKGKVMVLHKYGLGTAGHETGVPYSRIVKSLT
jgi:hypothetical protein